MTGVQTCALPIFTKNNTRLLTDSDLEIIPQIVTDVQNRTLTKPPTLGEVSEAVFSQPKDKTPGPDGFSIEFYQNYWNIIKKPLFEAIKAFFHSGYMNASWNHSFIALIPKVDQAISSQHFRPIGL